MKTLILSDIHANAPALETVLSVAGDFERIVFLGDLANYGPFPAECVAMLKKLDPICIMGNHDETMLLEHQKKPWHRWAREQLTAEQLEWISTFNNPTLIIDGHILLIHGAYSVDYDILPNTPDEDIIAAFAPYMAPEIDQVWFGHYHYQIDRVIDGVEYHCIRPVGQHRDHDTRTGYSVYENGVMTHHRVEYDLEKTAEGIRRLDFFEDNAKKEAFISFLQKAFDERFLEKDIKQAQLNAKRKTAE